MTNYVSQVRCWLHYWIVFETIFPEVSDRSNWPTSGSRISCETYVYIVKIDIKYLFLWSVFLSLVECLFFINASCLTGFMLSRHKVSSENILLLVKYKEVVHIFLHSLNVTFVSNIHKVIDREFLFLLCHVTHTAAVSFSPTTRSSLL